MDSEQQRRAQEPGLPVAKPSRTGRVVSTKADPATLGEARGLGATAFLDGPVDLALRRVVETAAR
jgi:hypothetical protein